MLSLLNLKKVSCAKNSSSTPLALFLFLSCVDNVGVHVVDTHGRGVQSMGRLIVGEHSVGVHGVELHGVESHSVKTLNLCRSVNLKLTL
jgi:hypothetical protein